MLTQTSETAIRALIYLTLHGEGEPIPPRQIAEEMDASPSYMAKITRMLVKANILRSHRGALGGVSFSRKPEEISLLNVVEACQGLLIGNYCESIKGHIDPVCAFHEAMAEVHQATLSVLMRWTLADLAARPRPAGCNIGCKINIALPGDKKCDAGAAAPSA